MATEDGEENPVEPSSSQSILVRLWQRRVQKLGLRPRAAAGFIAAFWIVGIVVFGIVEHLLDRDTFTTVWDGMWWATQTVTTVGYGDIVPEQTYGQIVAAILMVGGLSLFSVLTGVVTSAFVASAQAVRRAQGEDPVMQRLDELGRQLEFLRGDIETLSKRSDR